MTSKGCACVKKPLFNQKTLPSDCKFQQKTGVWWGKREACYVNHCYNKDKMKSNPPPFSSSIRLPTLNDRINPLMPIEEQIIEADYLCVRSCYCNSSCPHYQKKETNDNDTRTI